MSTSGVGCHDKTTILLGPTCIQNMMTVATIIPELSLGHPKFTRSSADAEGLRDVSQIQNIPLEKACNRGMTFKDT